MVRWHPFASLSSLEEAAAQVIMQAAKQAINQSGCFTIVLAGGTTPRQVYEQLKTKTTDWSKWHVYFGDERCLPNDSPDRNSTMAAAAWLNHVDIPAGQIHVIPAELGAEQAAQDYAETLRKIDQFDLVLLGLGEDGHTASLFPAQDPGTKPDSPATFAVHDAPKPPPGRVTLSARKLSQARRVLFLVTGESKRQAVKSWQSGMAIPASAICPDHGVDVYIDSNLL